MGPVLQKLCLRGLWDIQKELKSEAQENHSLGIQEWES